MWRARQRKTFSSSKSDSKIENTMTRKAARKKVHGCSRANVMSMSEDPSKRFVFYCVNWKYAWVEAKEKQREMEKKFQQFLSHFMSKVPQLNFHVTLHETHHLSLSKFIAVRCQDYLRYVTCIHRRFGLIFHDILSARLQFFFNVTHTARCRSMMMKFFFCVCKFELFQLSVVLTIQVYQLSFQSVFLMTFVHLDFVWHVERLFLVCLLRAVVVESDIPLYFAPASREKSLNVIKILRIRIAREKKVVAERNVRLFAAVDIFFKKKRFIRISSTAKCGILHSASDLTMEWCFHPLWTIWNFCKFCPITPPQSCEKLHIPDLDSTTYFSSSLFFHFALLNIWKLCHSSRESSSAGSVAMSEKILEISRLLILRWEFNWSWWMQQIEWHDNGRTATVCAF